MNDGLPRTSGYLWVKSCGTAGSLEVVAFPLSFVLVTMSLIKVSRPLETHTALSLPWTMWTYSLSKVSLILNKDGLGQSGSIPS